MIHDTTPRDRFTRAPGPPYRWGTPPPVIPEAIGGGMRLLLVLIVLSALVKW